MYTNEERPSFWERNKLLFKGFLIGILILIMLIPQAFISSLVYEREARQQEVVEEVSKKWAGAQTIAGPVLIVPYNETYVQANGVPVTRKKMAYFLPDELQINSDMQPEVRHRNLFEVTLYHAGVRLSGKFNTLPTAALGIAPEQMQWQEAHIAVGITDARGLENEVNVQWNGEHKNMESAGTDSMLKEGLSAPVTINAQTGASFAMDIDLRGSEHLYFTPTGKTTKVNLHAPWKDPAFEGEYLPTKTPDVGSKGFTAEWKILPISHTVPQYWKDEQKDLSKGAFGVKLIQPVDSYSKIHRSVKYALLFIALTFTVFFFLEIFQRKQVHPLQYILVGLALSIFYTLLLSVSEYTGFNVAYVLSAVATVSLIGMYVWGVFRNAKTGILFSASLMVLYIYIFVLIQLEDYALLFGSIGLFLILAVMMYYSRKIDWYALHKSSHKEDKGIDL